MLAFIAKAHMLETYMAMRHPQGRGTGAIGHRRLHMEQGDQFLHFIDRTLHDGNLLANIAQVALDHEHHRQHIGHISRPRTTTHP